MHNHIGVSLCEMLCRRLGWLNVWDPMCCEGYIELDLGIREQVSLRARSSMACDPSHASGGFVVI